MEAPPREPSAPPPREPEPSAPPGQRTNAAPGLEAALPGPRGPTTAAQPPGAAGRARRGQLEDAGGAGRRKGRPGACPRDRPARRLQPPRRRRRLRLSGCSSRRAPHSPLPASPSLSSYQCHREGVRAAAAATAAGTMVRRARRPGGPRAGTREAKTPARPCRVLGVRPPF